MRLKISLLATSALFAIAAGAPALAQTATPQTNDDQGAQIEEVVVTAERRANSVQKTAITITAISGETLTREGILSTRDMLDKVPGMDMTFGNPSNFIGLYGLMSSGGTAYADAVMTYNYAGIPLARQTAAASSLYDVERVEVLKGPQGTLYGKNATVGAMNVIPTRPREDYTANGTITVGNYETLNTTGAVNMPINDRWFSRIAYQTTRRDGYFTNGLDDANNFGVRGSLLYKPNEDVSLLLFTDFYRNRAKGPYFTWRYYLSPTQEWIDPGNPWFGLSPAGTCSNALLCPSFAHTSAGGVNTQTGAGFTDVSPNGLGTYSVVGQDGYSRADQDIYSAELNWRTPLGNLTVQAAHVDTSIHFLSYSNGLRFSNDTEAYQNTLEARLASDSGGRLKWVLGGFYFYETQDALQNNMQSTGWAILATPNLVDESYAFFGNTSFAVTPEFRLIGGLRWTNEEKSQDGYTTATAVTVPNMAIITSAGGTCFTATTTAKVLFKGFYFPTNFCSIPNGGSYQDDRYSWKVGAEWDWRPQSLLYATVSNGFRSGGFTVGSGNDYRPEVLTSYEIGSKNRFMDGRMQVNASAFYWSYTDQQLSQLRAYFASGIAVGQTSYPFNVDGNLYGAEVNFQYLLTERDRVGFTALYAKGKYDQTPLLVSSVGTTVALTNVDRYNLPEWILNATYNHMFDLGDAGELDAGFNAHYESDTLLRLIDAPGVVPGDRKDAYFKYDADLTWHPRDRNWTVQAWIKNITNEAVVGIGSSGQVSTPVFYKPTSNPTTIRNASLEPPRTFGVRLTFSF